MSQRRSIRLENSGYYDSDRVPYISYKEKLMRIFRKRKTSRIASPMNDSSFTDAPSCSYVYRTTDAPSLSFSDRNTEAPSWISTQYTRHTRYRYMCVNKDVNRGGMSKLTLFLSVLNILFVCVGLATLIPTLSSKFLHSESTALPNFALEELGASIIFQRTSETYKTQEASLRFFGIPLWKPSKSPKIVIKGDSPLIPGHCWPFPGDHGQLFIALSHRRFLSYVTLRHITKNLSPTGSISSAPKTFSVCGMDTLKEEGTQLGTFVYDQDGDSEQTFKIPDHKKDVFGFVELQVESNWGHPNYTCLYGFGVHGKPAD